MGTGAPGGSQWIGREVAGYRIDRRIGGGQSGTVYHAVSPSLNPPEVAIKILDVSRELTPEQYRKLVTRFAQEIAILRRLDNPHILRVLAAGEEAGTPFMVLPFISDGTPSGGTLAARLKSGPLPLDVVASYLTQLADALDHAHAAGVLHRDIKPANILLDGNSVYLTDFSIARLLDETQSSLTTRGTVVGTLAYMSPEQIRGAEVGPAADVYGLGIVLYQMVTGRLPFDATTTEALMYQQLTEVPPDPRQFLPDPSGPVAEAVTAVILMALQKQPQDRFDSAGALAQAFAAALRGDWPVGVPHNIGASQTTDGSPIVQSGTVRASNPAVSPPIGGGPGRPVTIAAIGALALVVLLLTAVLLNSRGGGNSGPGGVVTIYPPTYTPYPATSTTAPRQPTSTPYPPTSTPRPPVVATATPTRTATPTPTPTATPTLIDQAQVSNSGSGEQNPGDSFGVTFTATNSGTTMWSPAAGYGLMCVANCYGAGTQTLTGSVAPGQNATFNVAMTAPNGGANILNQNYSQGTSTWQMQHNGSPFGNQSSVTITTHGWNTGYGPTTPCAGSNGWVQIKPSADCGSLRTTSTYYPEMDLQGWLVSNTGQFRIEAHMDMTTNNSGNYEPGLIIDTPPAPAIGGTEFGARANGTWTVWKYSSGVIPVQVAQSAINPSTSYDLAVVVSGGTAYFYVDGNEVYSTATGNLNLSGNDQGVMQWWNVQSSNDTSSWSSFQLANWS